MFDFDEFSRKKLSIFGKIFFSRQIAKFVLNRCIFTENMRKYVKMCYLHP